MKLFAYILLIIIALSTIGMAIVSCKAVVPVSHTIHRTDSTIIREKLVPITVPGSVVATHIGKAQYDSLVRALKNMPQNNRVIYLTDPKLQTRLQIFLDSLGQLAFKCETLEREHLATITEKDRVINQYEKIIAEKKETMFDKIERFFYNGGIWLLIIIVAGILFYSFKKT